MKYMSLFSYRACMAATVITVLIMTSFSETVYKNQDISAMLKNLSDGKQTTTGKVVATSCIGKDVVLKGTYFSGSSFTFCEFYNVSFSRTDLTNIDFSYSSFINCNLDSADIDGATFENSVFYGTSLKSLNCSRAKGLERSHHYGTSFSNTILPVKSTWVAQLSKCLFDRSTLDSNTFFGISFSDCDFEFVHLSGASFPLCDFSKAFGISSDAFCECSNLFKASFPKNIKTAITKNCNGTLKAEPHLVVPDTTMFFNLVQFIMSQPVSTDKVVSLSGNSSSKQLDFSQSVIKKITPTFRYAEKDLRSIFGGEFQFLLHGASDRRNCDRQIKSKGFPRDKSSKRSKHYSLYS